MACDLESKGGVLVIDSNSSLGNANFRILTNVYTYANCHYTV